MPSKTARPTRRIESVDDLMGRCIVDDFTGCWHWQGAMNTDRNGVRTPCMYIFDSVRREFRTMAGPLAVLEVAGRRGPGVKMGWRTCRCDDCVNPEHIAGGTRKDWGRWMRASGFWKNVPARVAANRKSARERGELDQQLAEQIRLSPLNGREVAMQFGISNQQVSKVRTGKSWTNPVVPGASVFTLGAR